MGVESAINTDRLYGKILAYAARVLIKTAKKDGMPDNIAICLGFMNYLRPSVIDERGINANLMGAAVLASKAVGVN